ncbi:MULTISPECIES: hypothetical protein [Bizionia]|uniref:Uncharacterized protein n=1 Tax=Bizionia algoritergicola TaxID=291187 RepID=A0A5D0QSZ4_9FLAO|nr:MULTISPECIES: hypothetical protein [Bizionia]OBX22110.1 hypothetical protein BAA08_09900 [Bizionia sp. APA-3]TYB72343.1 hypothetical protein ES675_11290 [Bizionia algoritergicola]
MAKQKGIIPLVGTIGGINFYYLNGKPVAREAGGGFNGTAIKTKASMRRVRENGSEFGHCSRVNKAYRMALRPFYTQHKFTFFHSRLMTMFTQLKALDTINARGERRVANGLTTDLGQQLLQDFNYTPDCVLQQVLPFSFSMDWGTHTVVFPKFNMTQVSFIPGATHIALQFGVLDFNFETLASHLHLAAPVVLAKDFSGTSLSLTPTSLPSGLGLQVAVLGVRYYQEVDGLMYLLHARNGVGIGVLEVNP